MKAISQWKTFLSVVRVMLNLAIRSRKLGISQGRGWGKGLGWGLSFLNNAVLGIGLGLVSTLTRKQL